MSNWSLKPFQQDAVSKLIFNFDRLLSLSDSEVKNFTFQAPTGSGKTIIMAEFLRRLASLHSKSKFVFVWISLHQLHQQSKKKLTAYLHNTAYSLIDDEDLRAQPLADNTILFLNWESVYRADSVIMQSREDGRNLVNILEQTKSTNTRIVLIIDESHRNTATAISQSVINRFQPDLIIQVSATPLQSEIFHSNYLSIDYATVASSGLIKHSTGINLDFKLLSSSSQTGRELVVQAGLQKHLEISRAYHQLNVNIKPLILIQLPSESKVTSVLDKTAKAEIEDYLKQRNITYDNGRLALWLSGAKNKKNLQGIADNCSDVEVLIFKEAIAVGWDCPRAHILVMLRNIQSLVFEIQTVGRILRMPELKHYPLRILNQGYVYTDVAEIKIADDWTSPTRLHLYSAKLRVKPVTLPSIYLTRSDYGDLAATFKPILLECLDKDFKIEATNILDQHASQLTKQLELNPDKLQELILTDVILHNLDWAKEQLETLDMDYAHVKLNPPSEGDIQDKFDYLLRCWCFPYAPERSYSKLKVGLYEWFAKIGYSERDFVQKIIVCSTTNQARLSRVIEQAKSNYAQLKQDELNKRQQNRVQILDFNLPSFDSFGEQYEEMKSVTNYAYDKCYLRKNRSQVEKDFEQALARSAKVEWWYKNGVSRQDYFAILYEMDIHPGIGSQYRAFYPDFIVRFKDGRLGIYDTKAGMTVISDDTYHKSNALQAYIKEHRQEHDLTGGIIDCSSSSFSITYDEQYKGKDSYWKPFSEL